MPWLAWAWLPWLAWLAWAKNILDDAESLVLQINCLRVCVMISGIAGNNQLLEATLEAVAVAAKVTGGRQVVTKLPWD